MRAVLGYESPNKADALSLTFYYRMDGMLKNKVDILRERKAKMLAKRKVCNGSMWMAG